MKRSQLAGIIAIVCLIGSAVAPWSGGYLVIVGLGMLAAAIVFRVIEGRGT